MTKDRRKSRDFAEAARKRAGPYWTEARRVAHGELTRSRMANADVRARISSETIAGLERKRAADTLRALLDHFQEANETTRADFLAIVAQGRGGAR